MSNGPIWCLHDIYDRGKIHDIKKLYQELVNYNLNKLFKTRNVEFSSIGKREVNLV